MNIFASVWKPLQWLISSVLIIFLAGCIGDHGSNGTQLGSSTKAVTAYSLAGNTGTINESAKIIAVTVPYGTSLTALVATYTSSSDIVFVGTTAQTSGTTANDFTNSVVYTVTAGDGSTTTYTIMVTVASANAKAISAFSINGASGTISEPAKTIAVTVPYGTNPAALIATFTTTGANIKVGTIAQTTASTTNNFTSPVAYIVTAADGTTATYNVTVTVAANSAKAITAFSFVGYSVNAGVITAPAGSTPGTIAVILPYGTPLGALTAHFNTTGTLVKVGGINGTTQTTDAAPTNNFTTSTTTPVAYTVIAADNSTAIYNVSVSLAANTANAITAYSLAWTGAPAGTATGSITGTAIAVTVPNGTSLSGLVATFSGSAGETVKVGGTTQTSGTTPQNFVASTPFAYTVVAQDGTTTATYNVTVTVLSATTVLPGVAGTTNANATNPTVISAIPRDGATNVPTSTNSWNGTANVVTGTVLTATFDEQMASATITTPGTFTLQTTAGTNVPGTVTMNAGATVATFTPTATALLIGTSYTATVTTAAKNFGSVTAMPKNVVWSFTTNASLLTGQAPVNLLTAGKFVILAQTAITLNAGPAVTGDVGMNPNGSTSVTGSGFTKTQDASLDFWTSPQVVSPGKIYMSNDTGGGPGSAGAGVTQAKLVQATSDVITAYTDAAGRTAGVGTFLNVNGGDLTGQTLVPGTYTWSGASQNVTSAAASTVTISGGPDDIWIFQIQGYLNPGATSNMVLSNPSGGALPQAKNIFWAVAGSNVTPGNGAHMEGVILGSALAYITLNTGATANSRLLSQTAVTMNAGSVTQPAP